MGKEEGGEDMPEYYLSMLDRDMNHSLVDTSVPHSPGCRGSWKQFLARQLLPKTMAGQANCSIEEPSVPPHPRSISSPSSEHIKGYRSSSL